MNQYLQFGYQLMKSLQIHGYFPISQFFIHLYNGLSLEIIFIVERLSWWMHIMGILFFLNYLYYSKHLHILLAFPNTYFSNLDNPGKSTNLKSVYNEIKLMIDPSYKIPETELKNDIKFGASDIFDLNWFQLLNAYTCTCLLYTSPSPRDKRQSRMPSSA